MQPMFNYQIGMDSHSTIKTLLTASLKGRKKTVEALQKDIEWALGTGADPSTIADTAMSPERSALSRDKIVNTDDVDGPQSDTDDLASVTDNTMLEKCSERSAISQDEIVDTDDGPQSDSDTDDLASVTDNTMSEKCSERSEISQDEIIDTDDGPQSDTDDLASLTDNTMLEKCSERSAISQDEIVDTDDGPQSDSDTDDLASVTDNTMSEKCSERSAISQDEIVDTDDGPQSDTDDLAYFSDKSSVKTLDNLNSTEVSDEILFIDEDCVLDNASKLKKKHNTIETSDCSDCVSDSETESESYATDSSKHLNFAYSSNLKRKKNSSKTEDEGKDSASDNEFNKCTCKCTCRSAPTSSKQRKICEYRKPRCRAAAVIDGRKITCDITNKNIYVRKLINSEFSPLGQKKKKCRVWNQAHCCKFCLKVVTNISKHIRKHAHEAEVKEVQELSKKNGKAHKNIRAKWDIIRNEGDHIHNVKVLQEGEGEIILGRRHHQELDISQYGPCPACHVWIKLNKTMFQHQSICPAKVLGTSQCTEKNRRELRILSLSESGKLSPVASKSLKEEVFTIMTNDTISKVAQNDPLIVSLGNLWLLKNIGNKIKRKYYTSSRMRDAARLLINVRAQTNSSSGLHSFLTPEHFDDIVRAALTTASPGFDDEEDLTSPSTALKLGYDIKRMVGAKWGMALKDNDEASLTSAKNFLELMKLEWSIKVAKIATVTLVTRRFNKTKDLPDPDDLVQLQTHIKREISTFDQKEKNLKNYRRAVDLAATRLLMYNKRRSGEIEAISVKQYVKRQRGVSEVEKSMRSELSPLEQYLLESQELLEVRGKGGRGVPVIVPHDLRTILAYLADADVRRESEIPVDNNYLFPNTKLGVVRSYDAMKRLCDEVNLKNPDHITSVNLRKYTATISQIFDLSPQQQQWLVNHLGHSLDIHKLHYRQTSGLIERIDISKLMLLQEFNIAGKYAGKKLEDIQLSELVFGSSTVAMDITQGDDGNIGAAPAPLEGCVDCDDFVPDFQTVETYDEYNFDDDADEGVSDDARKRRKKGTRLSLDAIKRRLQTSNKYSTEHKDDQKPPLFCADIVLQIPNVVMKPGLDDLQSSLNKAVQVILKASMDIPQWGHMIIHQKQQQKEMELVVAEQNEEGAIMKPTTVIKPLHKIISEHKDVVKIVIQLNSIISTFKGDVQEVLNVFADHGHLWTKSPEEAVKEFMEEKPILSEIEAQIKYYQKLETELEEIQPSYRVGSVMFMTDPLKLALVTEARHWKMAFSKALNERCAHDMDEIMEFIENQMKKLLRRVKDLDDVRSHMSSLNEIRQSEIRIDMTITPIEEAYAMLNRYNILFNDGNAERVDTLSYGWKKLNAQSTEVQHHLLEIQPEFKSNLLQGVEEFKADSTEFVGDYDHKGPMVDGIEPREASDRLNIFQARFDELWRKFTTYSGGEELFGLPVTPYPELHRIKKELNLLQKLYQLYNVVLESVNGYYDIPWTEIDIEKINNELLDMQNKCRKLPKALKEWKAFEELKKTIDDFNETCPLLEMMANKAMMSRHWERMEQITGHKFEVEADTFLLRNLMEAPLLMNKEDIEDVCISAVKEKDIEAKLKQVVNDWSAQNFQFGGFKARGELLLKGETTSETVALMEDSLMVLGSLLSNRYNAPFKPRIQEWVQKLTGTTEIIENWLIVQNLWIYLEAVFVGGDIAKQLPQEAKRFANIDKSWIKIMQRAHETINVVHCCVGDDTMMQLLPHLLEQLEICQKSLTGYLEKKRLVFPRFFFVSDPALLEILGQASDSHTIQNHLLSVFDNTRLVTFDDKVYDKILSLNSQEGENVALEAPVMAQGNVEVWLGDLLKMSKRSVHGVIRMASVSIVDPGFNLIEFENMYPAQVGLLGIQMLWTRDAEDALTNARVDKKVMANTNQKFMDMLNELIQMTTTDLKKIERTKYETLITIHVHQKDIFDDLVRLHIRSPGDFEWLKQSRFYFKEDTDTCLISITDVDFSYQNEFLGCTERLVITPLTDRCYITLSQALGMALGGAPAGPAGTGKTESVKDMGRCLGKYVVVFNCSDQMDFRGLGRIYKGLAQSGSWGCFDEFNRIELPVLSVAAQQIAIVLACKKERKPSFIFTDGDTVDMDTEFGIFLTMNPGYAGRQELPENLKINFRTVAMMVPDRAIIIRVKLASCGFQQNVVLSKKFFTLYKLCEEQLTKQVHYDFGLRNILSVLRTLGAFKRANPEDPEPVCVMRILRDMNLSKLVDEDEPLFLSLIDDLFPGIVLDKAGYPEMEAAIEKKVGEAGLIHHDPWVLKLIQLFETQRVRHGMMTLGPSGAGKTKCVHTLMKAMTECGEPHKEMRMNPKAITAPQMFGRLDVATNDWTDGIFSTLWRRTHKTKKGEHIWLLLDGPVDAIWIENLNSVLDDNKTLTLANGDRIPMAPNCKIIFEVHNVDNASPATVSRNGMVFMSSTILDWNPILKGWLLTRSVMQQDVIFSVFETLFPILYTNLIQFMTPKMELLQCNYICQAIDLLEGLIPRRDDNKDIGREHLEKLIVFAIMWSLGALLEIQDRRKMEELVQANSSINLPQCQGDDTLYEYVVSDTGAWEHWSGRVPEYVYPSDSVPEYTSILVPNVDNVRTDFLIDTIAKQGKGVLLIGEQGTAKTVMIQGNCSKYDPEQHLFKSFNFSSATTPTMFQRTIEGLVDKRMGTTYGPPAGKKMTVFVDDINMPMINEWGDQITNEITRQMIEAKGFYNLEKPGEFTNIVDIQMMAAMIHPGGGRNDIPQRLKRQFNVFNCTLPSNSSIDKIFKTVGAGYFIKERGFDEEVSMMVDSLVLATRKVWQRTKAKMLPTPAKFHYVFNLRDLSRVWQGMLTTTSEVINNVGSFMSLWKHECYRVIADRFTEMSDKDWFEKTIKQVAEEDCGLAAATEMGQEPYFVDFLRDAPEATGEEDEDTDFEAPKVYEAITSLDELSDKLNMYMEQYNETVRGGKMDLVFFKDAMTNLVKISRVIRTPRGHALNVGVGGSGKQSLTRLASFIAGYSIFQITLSRSYNTSNLLDDLKNLYRTAGHKGQGITFIFTDQEIKDEAFLEYLNNILSSGEVSGLFARDEMDEILNELIGTMKKEFPRRPPSNENLYEYYLSRCRQNLHLSLCFSPVGEKFRSRSLKFPGLISGCTMNWFQRWPKDALIAVSKYFLSTFDIVSTPAVKTAIMNTMGLFQDVVAEYCTDYFQRYRRQTYVTPKSYLSFISGYKEIYSLKKNEIGVLAERMNTGLKKLVEATQSVNELSKELAVKEQELAVASKKADTVLVEVTSKATAAERVKAQVQTVKDKAQTIVDSISADKAVAMGKLEAARPALEAAEAALQTIKPAHISTVRKLAKPPHLIMRIMDCVLLLFQKRLDPVTQDPERPCVKPSWGEALKFMSGGGFLQGLLNFPKDSINGETVELLAPYLAMEDYSMESAKKVCGDVAGLAAWTEAMSTFYGINKDVLPLKANLAVQEARLNVAMTDLNQAQAELDEKNRELADVRAMYEAAMKEKQALLDDAEACRRKMNNATALIEGLGGEKVRWTAASKTFESQIQKLVGDVLLCTGFLSYGGPFNQEFRNQLNKAWKKEMIAAKIPFSDDLNIVRMLVDNATISEWNLEGLPNDDLSIQNGLIVTKAARFPLLIDPQGQGKIWIKNREGANEMQVTSLNHKYFRTHLEDSLSLGRPLLIEDVGEELDPALDNVLEKNFIKSGSTFKVKVGDKEVDIMKGFRLYITTKLGNPTYTPEISARTSIVDFTVTMKGLEDQLLGVVILTEKQELEQERTHLMEEVTANKRKMQELEDNLLYRLTSTEGSLVDDESLIEVLRVTKATAEDVSEKLKVAAETEIKINAAREEFRPVATRGSIVYFLIVEMSMVNMMYQTSLRQFLGLFDVSMAKSVKSPITAKRIANIIDYLTFEAFCYTARGLFEKDKFLFTILMTLKIEINAGRIKMDEFKCFIKGGAALDLNAVDPKPKKWILDMTWLNLVELSKLPQFSQILAQVGRNDKAWKAWFDEDAPEEAQIPDGYSTALDTFKKLLLIRSWCPDRAIPMARKYIAEAMGVRFAESVVLNMDSMHAESNKHVPLICFLSMGSDPTENIMILAKKLNRQCGAISMGQGQDVHARRLLSVSMAEGKWVLLQNCHLGLDFMDELLDTVITTENVNEDFRLWMTSEEHPKFPINMLQTSIKFTNEPPMGVKAGLKRTYALVTQEQLEYSNVPQWKPMLYAVAFLHTTVQERRKFGPIGWNIPYEFNQSDFTATVQFIQNHLDDIDPKKGVSWTTVRYMVGEVQYGGRVTDDYDKRLLNTYSRVWFSEAMFAETFQFYTGYKIPKCKNLAQYVTYIESLPLMDSPECFGLHSNADITYSTNTANSMLETIVNIQPKDSGGGSGETRESVVYKLADDMLEKLPEDYIPFEVKERLRKMGHLQPINIFLRQEIDRMQRVIVRVRSTLKDLKLAIDGTIIMSENLRDALDNMFDARVPTEWKKISWESATLGFWFTDLLDRNQQFHTWLCDGRPVSFWMTGFFNPTGFLTAMRQEITRAHKGWALDTVIMDNEVTKMMKEDVHGPPSEGVYIYGLLLDGAGWDRRNARLLEPTAKFLYTLIPVVHVFATNVDKPKSANMYECPVYKKPRRTDLTYIFPLMLKTNKNPDHWTLRGVALLCDTK